MVEGKQTIPTSLIWDNEKREAQQNSGTAEQRKLDNYLYTKAAVPLKCKSGTAYLLDLLIAVDRSCNSLACSFVCLAKEKELWYCK